MTTVLDVLQKELEESIESRKAALALGSVNDYAEYRQVVGVISGLTSTLTRVKDLRKYQEEN